MPFLRAFLSPSRGVVVSFIALLGVYHFLTEHATPLRRSAFEQTHFAPLNVPYLRYNLEPGVLIPAPDRVVDVSDTFSDFVRSDSCYLSSLDLHEPFEPLCISKDRLMEAMSGGGRAGWNMPYVPLNCDMRWFSTQEICDILSRFSNIILIGDSLIRHVTAAMHVFMRADLYEGGYTGWKDKPKPGEEASKPNDDEDCRCWGAFENGGCFASEAWSSKAIWENDPDSMQCGFENTAQIEYSMQNQFPLTDYNIMGLNLTLPKDRSRPEKPMAFVMGHGLWNDLEMVDTVGWINQMLDLVHTELPWLEDPRPGKVYRNSTEAPDVADEELPSLATSLDFISHMSLLFMTPNAGGEGKPEAYRHSQDNLSLWRFERAMMAYASTQQGAMDILGTWNLTVQSTSPDGTHADWRSDLVKAMMVFNWLDAVSGGMGKRIHRRPEGLRSER